MNGRQKVLMLCLIAVFCTGQAVSQVKDDGKKDDLYFMALIAGITEMEKSWGHIDGVSSAKLRTDYRNMVVEKNSEITNHLPSEFGDHHLEYLDRQALIAKYKILRREFPILVVQPLSNDAAELKTQITVYWVSYRHRKLNFGLSDWADIQFRYDCGTRAFTISAVKLGGI
jgi:hypothetical protein